MTDKPNPLKGALDSGAARRRTPGERSGGPLPEEEKLLTVSIPLSLHRRLKRAAAEGDENMRQIVMRLLNAELPRD